MSGIRKLIIFIVKVLVLILILSVLWYFLAPGYTSLLVSATDALAPSSIIMWASDSSIIIRAVGQAPAAIHSLPFQAGLLLLLALIIATPGIKVRQRLIYIVIGAVLTFVLHIVSVLIMTINVRNIRPLVVLFASVGIDLFPILIWAVLSARYWWPGRGVFQQPLPDQEAIIHPPSEQEAINHPPA